jgi:tetratricopeptide (TPR) repeat protein
VEKGCMRSISILVYYLLFVFFIPSIVWGQTRQALRQTAVQQLQKELFLPALGTLNDAIKQEPNASDLYFFRGYAKFGLDDFLGAEKDYSRSLELFPYQPDVLMNRAIVRSQMDKFQEAFRDFELALELDSADANIFSNRARVNLIAKNLDECIIDCYHAMALGDSSELIYLLKGSAEMGLGNHYTAITSFQKAVARNPENPMALIQYGAAYMELKQYDSANYYFNKAIELTSENIYALFNRALARINTKDKDGALSDLNEVISLSPYNSYAYFNRAIILNEMKRKDEAIRDLSVVIQLNPDNLISYYYRGLLRNENRDLHGAIEDFSRVIELYPDYTDAYMARSRVREQLKDRKGAARDYQLGLESLERNKNRPDTLAFDEKNYLENLIKLSGSFEEMNTMTSKFQNQYVDIGLAPIFTLFYGHARYDQIELYDSYPREHYYTSIISLANKPFLVNDSVKLSTIERQTHLLDSVSKNPESYLIRGVNYAGLDEFNLALSDYDTALLLDPDFVLLHFARGNALYGLYHARKEEAEAEKLPGIGEQPEPEVNPEQVARDSAMLVSIVTAYTIAIQLDPDFPFVYYNRGVVLAEEGRYEAALKDFQRAVDRKKTFAEGYYNLGLIYLLMKDKNRGCVYLSQAGELGIADAYRVMKRFCYE